MLLRLSPDSPQILKNTEYLYKMVWKTLAMLLMQSASFGNGNILLLLVHKRTDKCFSFL